MWRKTCEYSDNFILQAASVKKLACMKNNFVLLSVHAETLFSFFYFCLLKK